MLHGCDRLVVLELNQFNQLEVVEGRISIETVHEEGTRDVLRRCLGEAAALNESSRHGQSASSALLAARNF